MNKTNEFLHLQLIVHFILLLLLLLFPYESEFRNILDEYKHFNNPM